MEGDAVFYSAAQIVGGSLGVMLSALLLGQLVSHPAAQYAVTVPGTSGVQIAFFAESLIAFIQTSMVLRVSNTKHLARFTGVFAGLMVATDISLEAPYSGMSMNPARTFASALPANVWTALWISFTAPPLGMLFAAELYVRQHTIHQVSCAKLHHHNNVCCIFRCRFDELLSTNP